MLFRKDIDVSRWSTDVNGSMFMRMLLINHDVKSKTYIASLLKYWVFMVTHWIALPFAIIWIFISCGRDSFVIRGEEVLQGVLLILLIPFLIAWFAFTHIKKEN